MRYLYLKQFFLAKSLAVSLSCVLGPPHLKTIFRCLCQESFSLTPFDNSLSTQKANIRNHKQLSMKDSYICLLITIENLFFSDIFMTITRVDDIILCNDNRIINNNCFFNPFIDPIVNNKIFSLTKKKYTYSIPRIFFS